MLARNARQHITPAGQNATKQAGERTEGVELAVVFPANRVPPGVLDRPPPGASRQPHNHLILPSNMFLGHIDSIKRFKQRI